MDVLRLPGLSGDTVDLDLCFACHCMWFDPQENLKLAPSAVADLFRLLHERRDSARQPLASKVLCPHCTTPLVQGFDVVRSGRYITYRCPNRDGRLSTFSSFMIEKGFVRLLTRPEIDNLAQRVGVIRCSSCGAPVDLRKDQVCPHCRCAFSLIDPQAVEKALQSYARASVGASAIKAPDLADALVMLERDRQRAQREQKAQHGGLFSNSTRAQADLWAVGVDMVWELLN
jgi:hypothetical protein